eukprot:gene1756-3391_t
MSKLQMSSGTKMLLIGLVLIAATHRLLLPGVVFPENFTRWINKSLSSSQSGHGSNAELNHVAIQITEFSNISLHENSNNMVNFHRHLLSHTQNVLSFQPSRRLQSNISDINLNSPMAQLKCFNQTRCIKPVLQLQKTYNVYYCKHINFGVRFFFLIREGLLLHPNVRLVSNPDSADIIIYLPTSSEWSKSECGKPQYYPKLVVLDEGDGQGLFSPPNAPKTWSLLYFKRSYVKRHDGAFLGFLNYVKRSHVLPMTYSIADAYVRNTYQPFAARDIDLLCSLRGSSGDPVRLRVRQWVEDYGKSRKLKNFKAGQINSQSRTVVSTGYLEQMFRSQIIVTSNPSDWEGDFRLMEAMSSGALVFVDRMFVPRPYPLLEDLHVVYYDNNNKTELFEKLDAYRANSDHMATVAAGGYLHAMTYHRAACLIDYVLRTVHTLELTDGAVLSKSAAYALKLESQSGSGSGSGVQTPYVYTGFQMRQLALDAAKVIKKITRSAQKQKQE